MFTGPFILGVAPKWALSNNFMQWDYIQELVAHGDVPDVYDLRHKEENISAADLDLSYVNQFINFIQPINNNKIANSVIQKDITDKCLSEFSELVLKNHKEHCNTCHSDDNKIKTTNLLNTNKDTIIYSFCKNKIENLPEAKKEIDHYHKVSDCFSCLSEQSNIQNITQYKTLSKILEQYKNTYNLLCGSEEDKPLNLIKNLEDNKSCCNKQSEDNKKLCNFTDIKVSIKDCAISNQINHSNNIENCYITKYKEIDYGLLKFSDLDEISSNIKIDKTLLKTPKHKLCKNLETNSDCVPNKYLEQESFLALDKHLNDKTSLLLCEKKNKDLSYIHSYLNVKNTDIKSESSDEQINKSKHTHFASACKSILINWEDFEMSGQYPGHSRPPVGTPPPQTVWNHLTMAQSQGNIFKCF